MWKSSDRIVSIDMRSSVEVLLSGSLNHVDAHIPYKGGDTDEWSELYRAYSNPINSRFLDSVNELVMGQGLNMNSTICLVASSYYRGIMAANILSVAGYQNIMVELEGERYRTPATVKGINRERGSSVAAKLYWTNSHYSRVEGWLH
ncbi:MAG: hypothetical protein ABW098_13225 [Candidatus Thiodiazotropha sp.]